MIAAPEADGWRIGDVVRNADDASDMRSWIYLPGPPHPDRPWRDRGIAYHSDQLPFRVKLTTRGGKSTQEEWAP